MGGTGRLVSGLVDLIEGQGGDVRCGEEVASIVVEDGARAASGSASGETIARASIVVSNADSAWTYRHLLPAAARTRWTNRKIERARYSMGLFVWYFGTRRRYEDVAHHTILLGPRYRELLRDIFDRKTLSRRISASICIARPQPILRLRRKVATRSMCSRPCPICSAGRTGASRRNPIGKRSLARWRTRSCRDLAVRS